MNDMAGNRFAARTSVIGKTRRGLLRLALAGPALLAGLQLAGTSAHADDDDPDNGRGRPDNRPPRIDNQAPPPPINLQAGRRSTTFNSDLVPVNAVDTSDFNPGNSDSGFGSLAVGAAGTAAGSINVMLQGATANQAYTLAFVPLGNAGARQSLGAFTTNANGNGRLSLDGGLAESGSAPDRLGTRVGVFVLRRGDINGPDAFVTAA